MTNLDSHIRSISGEEIARVREISSKDITEMSVYQSVVENVVNMDGTTESKIDILLQAVPDLGIIICHLSKCKSSGMLEATEYTKIVNQCLLKLNKTKQGMKFDPTMMGWALNGA